jgi:hypothetical protein
VMACNLWHIVKGGLMKRQLLGGSWSSTPHPFSHQQTLT